MEMTCSGSIFACGCGRASQENEWTRRASRSPGDGGGSHRRGWGAEGRSLPVHRPPALLVAAETPRSVPANKARWNEVEKVGPGGVWWTGQERSSQAPAQRGKAPSPKLGGSVIDQPKRRQSIRPQLKTLSSSPFHICLPLHQCLVRHWSRATLAWRGPLRARPSPWSGNLTEQDQQRRKPPTNGRRQI